MATVSDVLDALAAMAPFSKAARWDAVGLQVGDGAAAADRVAVCHEITEAAVEVMLTDPPDLVIVYHPLLFSPAVSFVAAPSPSGRGFRLTRAGISVAVVHTAFDVVEGGSADALAEAIGLSAVRGFGPAWGVESIKIVTFVPGDDVDRVEGAMAAAGAGRIGAYSGCSFRTPGVGSFLPGPGARPLVGTVGVRSTEPEIRLEMIAAARSRDQVVAALVAAHPYEEPAFDVYEVEANAGMVGRVGAVADTTLGELAAFVGATLGSPARFSGGTARPITRIAVIPGSGSSFLGAAHGIADVLITGDVGHHDAMAALDAGLAVIDAGHIPSERPGIDALYAAVSRIAPGAIRIDSDPHPWEEI